jgi:hypothetical protein
VISRSERNFAGATFPSIHLDRDHHYGGDLVGIVVNGGPEFKRRSG